MVAESFSQIPSAGRTQTMTDKTAWTPEQFWEYVGGLAGEHEAGQMRDTLQHVGLLLVKTSDYNQLSEQIGAAVVWTVEADGAIVSVWLTKGAADKIAEHHRERAPKEKWRVAPYRLVSSPVGGDK